MTKADKVRWTEPPSRPTQYDWSSIADQLRENPGEWALVFEQDRASLAHAIRQGSITHLRPEDGFEVQTRKNTRESPRRCDLYLRYVPPKRRRKK